MTLHELNTLTQAQLKEELFRCCGSLSWVNKMLPFFPADDLVELLEDAEEQWFRCSETDWKEAFAHHPKIGEKNNANTETEKWAAAEQGGIGTASRDTLDTLAEANKEYEEKFGYIFIVCATGKSADEILTILRTRLQNTAEVEIEIAADEQNKITKLRIEKLLD
ncbi:MAG: 2-oxo-4-hydroxy-4-carboxy-5-ureidoimidazoline decarboxylase [Chitinophagaceae bacterium]